MESVLIISSGEQEITTLSGVLHAALSVHDFGVAKSGTEARRELAEKEFDLVVINTPLPDEFGHELAIFISDQTLAGVVLLVKGEIADDLSYRVEEYGVLVVEKPLSGPALVQSIRMLMVTRRRMLGLRRENIQLQDKMEEMRRIDRAKFLLMQSLGMSEQEAHRHIEKQAMDGRISRRQVVEGILETYGG